MVELTRSAPRRQTPWAIAPFQAWELTDGEPWAEFYRSGDGILVRFPDYADFELSSDGRRVVCAPTPDVSPETIEHLYFNQILPLVLGRLGKLVFHASAVEIEGFAVAFPAPSGRGKSSLAAAFAADGNPFLTDDGLFLEPFEVVTRSNPVTRRCGFGRTAGSGSSARIRPSGAEGELHGEGAAARGKKACALQLSTAPAGGLFPRRRRRHGNRVSATRARWRG